MSIGFLLSGVIGCLLLGFATGSMINSICATRKALLASFN